MNGYAWAPPATRIGLNDAVTRQAWKQFGWSLAAFIGGTLLTIVGLATGILAIIGVILAIGGLIATPIAFFRLFDPTSIGSIKEIAATSHERRAALERIEAEILHPSTWRMRAGTGTLYVTSRILVFVGSSVEIAPAQNIVGFWEKVKRSSRWVCFKTRAGHTGEIDMLPHDVAPTLHALARVYPHVQLGYGAYAR